MSALTREERRAMLISLDRTVRAAIRSWRAANAARVERARWAGDLQFMDELATTFISAVLHVDDPDWRGP